MFNTPPPLTEKKPSKGLSRAEQEDCEVTEKDYRVFGDVLASAMVGTWKI